MSRNIITRNKRDYSAKAPNFRSHADLARNHKELQEMRSAQKAKRKEQLETLGKHLDAMVTMLRAGAPEDSVRTKSDTVRYLAEQLGVTVVVSALTWSVK